MPPTQEERPSEDAGDSDGASWRGGALLSGGGLFASLSPQDRIAVDRLMADFRRYEAVREVPRAEGDEMEAQ